MKAALFTIAITIAVYLAPMDHVSLHKGHTMFPGGILRNNPGNVVNNERNQWVGMWRLQKDEKFPHFKAPVYGLRAMMKTLLTYQDRHDLNTISKIIHRWAPPRENNTSKYIHNVSMDSGFAPDAPIDLHSVYTLIELSKAIVIQENGAGHGKLPIFWYEDNVYREAAEMALEDDE